MVSLVQVREGAASTNVVQWPRVVIRRWFGDGLRSYSSWALWGFERGRPRGSLPSAFWPVVCSSLWAFFVCVVLVVEVAVLLLFRFLFFVVCLAAFPLLSGWSSCSWLSRWIPWLPGAGCGVVLALRVSFVPGFCLRGARLWYFCRFRRGFVFWPFSRHCPSCGVSARWRDLRHVVLTFAACSFLNWRVASEFFWSSQLLIQEDAERRGLHGLR